MAFVVNRSATCRVLAKAEITANAGAYGTDVSPASGTDDLLAFTNPNPLQVQTNINDIMGNAFSGTFTQRPGINNGQRASINLEFLMMGSGTRGSIAVNGYRSIDALLMSCGLWRTWTTTTSITYVPVSILNLEKFEDGVTNITSGGVSPCTGVGSCNISVETGGWTHKTRGVWGNIVFEGTPTTGVVARYTGQGSYIAPTATSLASGFTGGSVFQKPFLGVLGQLQIYSASAYTVVGHSFRFDVGTQVSEVMDFNNSTGLWGFVVTGRRPSATLVIAAEHGTNASSAAADQAELYAAMNAQTAVSWTCTVGNAVSGQQIVFSIPTGRITNIQLGQEAGHRTYEITIVPTGQSGAGSFSAETEFGITIT